MGGSKYLGGPKIFEGPQTDHLTDHELMDLIFALFPHFWGRFMPTPAGAVAGGISTVANRPSVTHGTVTSTMNDVVHNRTMQYNVVQMS